MTDDLNALADRIEAATGPDVELDRDIAAAAGWRHRSGYGWDKVLPWERPAYTASLDAALTLVPEGWLLASMFQRNCKLPNWIWKAELWFPAADRNVVGIARNAATPALALCAAALRACAQQEGQR